MILKNEISSVELKPTREELIGASNILHEFPLDREWDLHCSPEEKETVLQFIDGYHYMSGVGKINFRVEKTEPQYKSLEQLKEKQKEIKRQIHSRLS